jgi:hypothetical protein
MNNLDKIPKKNNLGFGDNKVIAPKCNEDVIVMLSQIMAAAVNNSIELENAKVALTAATRIIEVQQADTRMKALAITTQRIISSDKGWALVQQDHPVLEARK